MILLTHNRTAIIGFAFRQLKALLLVMWVVFLPQEKLFAQSEGVGALDLEISEKHYISGKYKLSRDVLEKVHDSELEPKSSILQRYLLLQARLSAVHEEDAGMRTWLQLLAKQYPDTTLNYYTDPPQILQAWQEILQSQSKDKNAEVPGPEKEIVNSGKADAAVNLREQSSSVMSLLPFGIGAYHAGEYSRGLLFTLGDLSIIYFGTKRELPLQGKLANDEGPSKNRVALAATTAFLGSWGYQALFTERDRASKIREDVWFGLSFFPFGVGQLKNGQPEKALGFGLTQAGLLMFAINTTDKDLADIVYAAALGGMIFGAYDGWYYHQESSAVTRSFRVQPLLLPPPAESSGIQVGLQAHMSF